MKILVLPLLTFSTFAFGEGPTEPSIPVYEPPANVQVSPVEEPSVPKDYHWSGGNFQDAKISLNTVRFNHSDSKKRVVLDFSSKKLPWCVANVGAGESPSLQIECENVSAAKIPKTATDAAKRFPEITNFLAPYIIEGTQLVVDWGIRPGSKVSIMELEDSARLVIDFE